MFTCVWICVEFRLCVSNRGGVLGSSAQAPPPALMSSRLLWPVESCF